MYRLGLGVKPQQQPADLVSGSLYKHVRVPVTDDIRFHHRSLYMVTRAILEHIHGVVFKFLPILAIRARCHREAHEGQSGPMAGDGALGHLKRTDGQVPRRRAATAAHAD